MNTQRVEGHTPTPWRACKEGECSCGQIWSIPADHPVVDVLSGVWGDTYPAIRLTEGPGMYGTTAEAYLERIDYGRIDEEVAKANAKFIVHACNNIERLEKVNEALVPALEETTRALESALAIAELAESISPEGAAEIRARIDENRAALKLAKEPA